MESTGLQRSTFAEAWESPNKQYCFSISDTSSVPQASEPPVEPQEFAPFLNSSRAVIQKYVNETTPISQPGHSTLVFNAAQKTDILRVVADESETTSYEMLKSVVRRASRLSLNSPQTTQLPLTDSQSGLRKLPKGKATASPSAATAVAELERLMIQSALALRTSVLEAPFPYHTRPVTDLGFRPLLLENEAMTEKRRGSNRRSIEVKSTPKRKGAIRSWKIMNFSRSWHGRGPSSLD